MKVLIMTDLEGVAGVVSFEDQPAQPGVERVDPQTVRIYSDSIVDIIYF